jgi:MATE family multidrug resistance protein
MASTMVMEFTDRVFLANYSLESIAAALPAGIAAYLFISFFAGTAGYVNVFIAQYTGAGALNRVGYLSPFLPEPPVMSMCSLPSIRVPVL